MLCFQLDAAQRCLIDMEALRCESQHYEKRCQVLQDELSSLRGSLQLKEEKSVKFLPPAVDPNDEIIKLKVFYTNHSWMYIYMCVCA